MLFAGIFSVATSPFWRHSFVQLFLNGIKKPVKVKVIGASDILVSVSTVQPFDEEIADLTERFSTQVVLPTFAPAKKAAGGCTNPDPITRTTNAKPPFSKKGLGGDTMASQPISQTVLELELEVRTGEVNRAALSDSFIMRPILAGRDIWLISRIPKIHIISDIICVFMYLS